MKIELAGQSEVAYFGLTVSLHDLHRPEQALYSSAESGDVYTFRHIPDGDYTARVFAPSGELLKEEMIRVSAGSSFVRLQLPQPRITRPPAERVSVRQLQNPPSPKAIRAFQAAQKLSAAGQMEKAAVELEKAIRISPAFAPAHTNLAAMRIRLHDFARAVDEATLAMRLDAPNVTDLCNRALAQWALARYDDAMHSAEEALRIDANAVTAHFVLGSLLAEDTRTVREGIRHLERAAERYPEAARNLERARAKLR